MTERRITHERPAWGERADRAVPVTLEVDTADERLAVVEELSLRGVDENLFEVCCVPFFAFGLALGDQIRVESRRDGTAVVREIATRSGRSTFWMWSEAATNGALNALERDLQELGCLTESHDGYLIACDADSLEQSRRVFALLQERERQGDVGFSIPRNTHVDDSTANHSQPAWADRADSTIHARLEDDYGGIRFEELAVREVEEDVFEICCIPFFVYDVAMGDHVEATPDAEEVVERLLRTVTTPSPNYTFRVAFFDSDQKTRVEVVDEVVRLGCLWEQYSYNLIAVHAEEPVSQAVADFLWERHEAGALQYETGLRSARRPGAAVDGDSRG